MRQGFGDGDSARTQGVGGMKGAALKLRGQSVTVTAVKIILRAANAYLELHCAKHCSELSY